MPKFIFQQSNLPNLGSRYAERLGKHLFDFKMYCRDHRYSRDLYVRECDDAYLAKRYIPDMNGMELIEDGEFGETDVRDNAALVSIRLALSLMDTKSGWLAVSSPEKDEDPKVTQALTDYNLYLHYKAKTRRQIQRFIKQGHVRGSSYLHFDWQDVYRERRLTDGENGPALAKFMKDNGLTARQAKKLGQGRARELQSSGPIITPIDFYDVWVEPFCDIVNQGQKPAHVLQRFRRLAKLRSEKDENGKDVYSNLDKIEEWTLEELYQSRDFMAYRVASERLMGNTLSSGYKSNITMVPVYIMYFPYLEFEGQEFWDTYFHLAISRAGNKPIIIKIEENPNDLGINHLLMDHYEDWFTNTPYGLSPVQFQLSKLNQKNLLQLLFITGAAMGVIPPKMVYGEGIRDDEEISFLPGHIINVMENSLGLEVIKDLPMPNQGAMMGTNFARFLGDDLRASSGVDGLSADNPTRTASKEKTATEIDRDTTAGSYYLQNQSENLRIGVLQELVQGVFELARVNAKSLDDSPGVIQYEKFLTGRAIQADLSMKDLQQKRSIQVIGQAGLMNQAQQAKNMLVFFQILSQIPDPRVAGLKVWVAQQIGKQNDIIIPEEFTVPAAEAVAMNPEVQQAALGAALQNPQVQQLIVQTIENAGGHIPGITHQGPPGTHPNQPPTPPGAPGKPQQQPAPQIGASRV